MKKSLLLFVFAVLMYGTGVAQKGNGNGNSNNPWDVKYVNKLYVNKFLKVGLNSIWLTPVGPQLGNENRFFATNGPLVINGVHSATSELPFSPGNNTLINPNKGSVGLGLGAGTPGAKLDISIGSDYLYKESGLRITVPIPASAGEGPFPNKSIFEIRKEFNAPDGSIGVSSHLVTLDNGNVGVGIAVPKEKFHLHGGVVKLTGNNLYGGPMILFGGSPTAAPYGHWAIEYLPEANGSPGLNFWKPGGSTNTGNYYLFLSNSGQIGMGVDPADFTNLSTSGFRLHVKDGIITEKVKVELIADWADHVFEKEYELLPLHKVESFIKENGHLPNVPSAAQVKEDGIDVARMDAKLLEKIEELTLYILEQDKRIHELENTINPAK